MHFPFWACASVCLSCLEGWRQLWSELEMTAQAKRSRSWERLWKNWQTLMRGRETQCVFLSTWLMPASSPWLWQNQTWPTFFCGRSGPQHLFAFFSQVCCVCRSTDPDPRSSSSPYHSLSHTHTLTHSLTHTHSLTPFLSFTHLLTFLLFPSFLPFFLWSFFFFFF